METRSPPTTLRDGEAAVEPDPSDEDGSASLDAAAEEDLADEQPAEPSPDSFEMTVPARDKLSAAEIMPGSLRSARLPRQPAPRDGQTPEEEAPASSHPSTAARQRASAAQRRKRARTSSVPPQPTGRTTLISRLSRMSVEVAGRTTLTELATLADSIVDGTRSRVPPRFGFRVLATFAALALLVLLLTAALAIGRWRWLPIAFLFVAIAGALGWSSLRAVPRLAKRVGDKQLPGRATAWFTLGFALLASASWGLTVAVSEVATTLGRASWPKLAPYLPERITKLEEKPAPPPEEPHVPRRKKTRRIWATPGLLMMPPQFEPDNGRFDLIIHFHGDNTLLTDSLAASNINTLVHVTNLGDSSARYARRFERPDALELMISAIEAKTGALGYPDIKVRRIALMFWSAGYGAARSILSHAANIERLDAVLGLDGIHAGFMPYTNRELHPDAIAPFVSFAEQAIAQRKLMVLTHSAIPTATYGSTTESINAILTTLNLERVAVEKDTSPPEVTFASGVRAFPRNERHWLSAKTAAQRGNFYVYGYAGNTKGDHIAHLAQLSVTVLPKLRERWAQQDRRSVDATP